MTESHHETNRTVTCAEMSVVEFGARACHALVRYSHYAGDVSSFANDTSTTNTLPQWLKEYPDGEAVLAGVHR